MSIEKAEYLIQNLPRWHFPYETTRIFLDENEVVDLLASFIETTENKEVLLRAERDGISSLLLTVQQESIKQRNKKDGAYLERNKLVALLASLYPSGIKKTSIEGWSDEWHGCVYIDFPWGQASWHYHDSQSYLFDHLPPYQGEWNGHTTEQKYEEIVKNAKHEKQ